MQLPHARTEDILVQELDDEMLAYDRLTHQVFCLNQAAGVVYRACIAKASVEDVKREHDFSDEVIFLALDQLKKANLVAVDGTYRSPLAGVSRREVIKRFGLVSLTALPLISSIPAPTPAAAQSQVPTTTTTSPTTTTTTTPPTTTTSTTPTTTTTTTEPTTTTSTTTTTEPTTTTSTTTTTEPTTTTSTTSTTQPPTTTTSTTQPTTTTTTTQPTTTTTSTTTTPPTTTTSTSTTTTSTTVPGQPNYTRCVTPGDCTSGNCAQTSFLPVGRFCCPPGNGGTQPGPIGTAIGLECFNSCSQAATQCCSGQAVNTTCDTGFCASQQQFCCACV